MNKQFYEKVLPTQGVYCATGIVNGSAVNKFAETLDGLYDIINDFSNRGCNTYVALNTFNGFSRKGDGAIYARSFFLDLDVGQDEPQKYQNKTEALIALGEFVDSNELPPPIVVDSGTGIHAYWPFEDDVPSDEWKVYAEKFKAFCLREIKIDPVVTADKARILRCPETLNYKTDPPTPSKFITEDFPQYDFEAFKDFLGVAPTGMLDILKQAKKGLDEETRKILKQDNIETLFSLIAEKSLTGKGCNQINTILVEAATLAEPLWHSGLSIARQCDDWEEAIQLMSEDYPSYNRELTIKKANETFDKPHSCEVFESRNPGGCEGCAFRGKITNPLHFGRSLKEPDAEEVAVWADEDTASVKKITKFPDALKPFKRGATGGVYYQPKDSDPILIWPNDIYPIKRMYGARDGEMLLLRHDMPHDAAREFLYPMKNAYSLDETQRILGTAGCFPDKPLVVHLQSYFIKWAAYMVNTNKADQTIDQMGWTEDNKGFAVGKTEYHSDGTEARTAASSFIYSVSKLLGKDGTYEKWQAAANKLNTEGLEICAFGLLCGFGSPLMRYTHINGVNVCFTGESGNGKSGSLFAALSLWGEPKQLSLAGQAKTSATQNALTQWMLGLKNIMMGLDEASNRPPEEVSDLIYKVSEGKGKLRMQASVNAVRDIEFMSSLINLMASNHSLTSKLQSIKNNPDGELARLVEFDFAKPKPFLDDPTLAPFIFEGVRVNYGHAGPAYIKKVFEVGDDAVREKIKKWQDRFVLDFGNDTTNRFYDCLIGITFAGGEIAIEAGVVDFDLERIYKVVLKEIKAIKATARPNNTDYESILGEFNNNNIGGALILDGDRILDYPRNKLVTRIEVDRQMLFVSASALREYFKPMQVDMHKFITHMETKKILIYKGKRRLTDGWAGRSTTSPISVFGFNYPLPPDFIEKLKEASTSGNQS
jgi:hypothetical protein